MPYRIAADFENLTEVRQSLDAVADGLGRALTEGIIQDAQPLLATTKALTPYGPGPYIGADPDSGQRARAHPGHARRPSRGRHDQPDRPPPGRGRARVRRHHPTPRRRRSRSVSRRWPAAPPSSTCPRSNAPSTPGSRGSSDAPSPRDEKCLTAAAARSPSPPAPASAASSPAAKSSRSANRSTTCPTKPSKPSRRCLG